VVTRRQIGACVALLLIAQAGCELEEVVIPVGEPVVIVQAVMRPDRAQQFVVVEWSFTGLADPDELTSVQVPSGSGPHLPIENATVRVVNLDFPTDPCGDTTRFTFTTGDPSVPKLPGVYWAPAGCPTLRPGDRMALTVRVPGGSVVTGQTRVPGMAGATLRVAGQTVAFGGPDITLFNRDRDTLRVDVEPIVGRLIQVEAKRIDDESAAAGSKLFADTTAVAIPGNLPDILPGGGGEDIFRAGRRYALTAALSDTNYFDFARSRNNPITGRGFINRLDGGIGVFGSLTSLSTVVEVTGDFDDPREGRYLVQGVAAGVDIDAELLLYLARSIDSTAVSGFLSGTWMMGGPFGPEGGFAWVDRDVNRLSIDGTMQGDSLVVLVPGPGGMAKGPLVVRALLQPGGPSTGVVIDSLALGRTAELGDLSFEKQ
jgi:hypothetical protein